MELTPVVITIIVCITVFFIAKFAITAFAKLGTRFLITYSNTHLPPKPKDDPTIRQEINEIKSQLTAINMSQGISRPATRTSLVPGR